MLGGRLSAPTAQLPLCHSAAIMHGSAPLRCAPRQHSPRQAAIPVRAAAGLTYKSAGVDIDAGSELVRRIQKMNPSIGGFSGMVPFGVCLARPRCLPRLAAPHSWTHLLHSCHLSALH